MAKLAPLLLYRPGHREDRRSLQVSYFIDKHLYEVNYLMLLSRRTFSIQKDSLIKARCSTGASQRLVLMAIRSSGCKLDLKYPRPQTLQKCQCEQRQTKVVGPIDLN